MLFPNPRFPHTCKVFRAGEDGDAFDEGKDDIILYEGECRNYITTRNIGDSKVQSSQYTLAIPAYREITEEEDGEDTDKTDKSESTDNTEPKDDETEENPQPEPEKEIIEIEGKTYERIIVKAQPGDKVICTDARGMETTGVVVDCYAGTMGNNVYWNYDAN